jgi:hypothetical protein
MRAPPAGKPTRQIRGRVLPPNKPMKLTVAFGARSLSARRWADGNAKGCYSRSGLSGGGSCRLTKLADIA